MDSGTAGRIWGRADILPCVILIIVTIACLVPFSGKAFHIDDTLFLWAAKHIQSNPADPYNFPVNWYGTIMPMSQVMKNPPLNCYFIAWIARLAGWNETAFHLAFLLPAIAVILGTCQLARYFCNKSWIAALLTLLSPAFLVSSTTIMCDVPMLAFWIWAVVLWIRGIEKNSALRLVAAAILIALSALTKYYGMSLIPLLLIYTVIKKRRLGWCLAYLLIPIAILGWYQYATAALYGRGLLLDAADYATVTREGFGATFFPKALVGLAFLGGCFLAVLAYAFLVRSKKWLAFGALFVGALVLLLSANQKIGAFRLLNSAGETRWLLIFQLGVLAAVGTGLIILAVREAIKRLDADSTLLSLWIIGTLLFAACINWTVNVRSILPLIPAASILLVRWIENTNLAQKTQMLKKGKKQTSKMPAKTAHEGWGRWIYPLVPVALIGFAVAYADCRLANSARTAAAEIRKQYAQDRIWFEGHWGFQYYMESSGGMAVNFQNSTDVRPGDILVMPVNNTNIQPVPEGIALLMADLKFNSNRGLATMSSPVGAGFYADVWGPLPYAFGAVPPERYMIYRINLQSNNSN